MKTGSRLLGWVALMALMLLGTQAFGKNADLSRWLKNLSETAMESAPGDYDAAPEIVVSGDTVHVLWSTRTADWSVVRIYYRRSLDKGKTWQPKVLITERSKDDLGVDTTYRKMAVDGENVHIFLAESRHTDDSWYGVMSYFRSTDNGNTFEDEREIVTAAEAHKINDIYAHAVHGKVKVGYTYIRNWEVKDSINVLVSDDNGDTFVSHQVAFFDGERGGHEPTLYDMQVDGEKVYLVYGDPHYFYGLSSARLYFARSLDGGLTFNSREIDVPSDEEGTPKSMADQDDHYVPKIAFAGSNVYTVFNGYGPDGNFSVFFRRSEDNGTTFAPAINLSHNELPNEAIRGGQVTLAARGTKVYVLIQADSDSHSDQLYLKRSLDGGRSFKPMQTLTVPNYYGAWATETWWPVIKLDPSDSSGSKVYVAGNGLFFVYSDNSGARFTGPIQLAPYYHADLGRSQIALGDDGTVHMIADGDITWYETGVYGDSDIFYRVFDPVVPVRKATTNKALYLTHKENEGDETGIERWDMMQIASSPALEFKNAMTVEAWIKVKRSERGGFFIVKTGAYAQRPYMLGQSRDGKIDAVIVTEDGEYEINAGEPIPNDKWTHVAMTYNSKGRENNFKVYVDGELVGEQTATGSLLQSRYNLLIGGWEAPHLIYNNLSIDELRFWNRALSRQEIQRKMKIALSGKEAGLVAYYTFDEPFNRYGTVRDITGKGNKGILLYKERLNRGKDFVLKVLAPNGRERVAAGRAYKISWQAPLKAVKFNLFYSTDNRATWKSIAKVGNIREYRWRVPAQSGKKPKCFVKVVAKNTAGKVIGQDLSNRPFTIDVLKLVAPNGGETLKAQSRYLIRWRTYALTRPVAKVLLQYSINGGKRWKTFKTFMGKNPGRFRWAVPKVSSTNCKIRILLKDSNGKNIAADASDKVFTIEKS